MHEDDTTETLYSVTLTRIQVWASVIISFCTIVAMFVGGIAWSHSAIRKIADQEFQTQLRIFHTDAQPEIAQLIEEKIQKHALIAAVPFDGRLKTIEERITALEVTVSLVIPDLKSSVDKNSNKLDRVLDKLAERK